MGAVRYRAAAELRSSWRGAAGLAIAIALVGGVVLGCVAGARRTASAFDRLLQESSSGELLVSIEEGDHATQLRQYSDVAALDEVSAVAGFALVGVQPVESDPFAGEGLVAMAPIDELGFREVDRPKLVAGRLPDPDRPEEVLARTTWAEQTGVGIGDRVDARILSTDEWVERPVPAEVGEPIELVVTGVGVLPTGIVPFDDLDRLPGFFGTPALFEQALAAGSVTEAGVVVLEPGTDAEAVLTDIERRSEAQGTGSYTQNRLELREHTRDALRPLALSLVVVALAVGMAGVVLLGQALARHVDGATEDRRALHAIGFDRAQLRRVMLIRVSLVATLGAVGATAAAGALSARFPLGLARLAEPDPGVRLDAPVLVVGALALVLTLVSSAWLLRPRSSAASRARGARLATSIGRLGLPVAPTTGVRFALGAGGPQSTGSRSTIAVAAGAVCLVIGSVTFSGSLDHLLTEPTQYGQTWDMLVDAGFGPAPAGLLLDGGSTGAPQGVGAGYYGELAVGDASVPAIAFETLRGDLELQVLRGRAATRADEVALGGEVLEDLGLDVGDELVADPGDGEARAFRIVGEVVFPSFAQGSFVALGMGSGAQLAPGALVPSALQASVEQAASEGGVPIEVARRALADADGRLWNFVTLAYDGTAPDTQAVQRDLDEVNPYWTPRVDQRPSVILDLDRVRTVPAALAALFVLLAAGVLVHGLAASFRDRRRELALLRALGVRRGGARSTVRWQAATTAVVASAIGVPLGVAAGGAIWREFAHAIHAPTPATIPWAWLAVVPVVAVALALAVSQRQAHRAASAHAAQVLRAPG